MSNVSRLDKRAIYITYHLFSDARFTNVSYELHNYIRLITSKPNKAAPLKYTSGLISALDFADSKEGIYSTRDPHIHAIAVLGQPISERDCLAMMGAISGFLSANPHVRSNSVHIRKFEIFQKDKTDKVDKTSTYQMLNIIDYNRKKRLGNDREVLVLPYHDIMIDPDKKQLKDTCSARVKQIMADLEDHKKHHLYFSEKAL